MTAGRLVVLALIAGVLLTSGAFLDWSGVDYSSRLDRGLALLAGCVAIVSAALALLWRLRVLALAIASGALGLNMAIVNIKDISSHDFEYAKYPDATVGAGLYLVLGGAALALAVGLAALLPRRYLSREQPRQERTSGKWVSRPSTGPSRRVTLVSTTHSRTGDPRVDVRLKAIETRSTGRGASVLPSRVLARVGAGAALLGGIAWAVKGAVILTTGEQPPFVFALGPPLFAVGLIGLYARLGSERGRAASAGLLLACASILLAGVLLVAWAFANEALPAGEDDFTPLSLVIAGAGFSFLAGLVLLGVAARRAEGLPARWRALPLVVGVLAVPAVILGGLLSVLSERLLEIPLVAFALAWIAIAYVIWPSAEAGQVATTAAGRRARRVRKLRRRRIRG